MTEPIASAPALDPEILERLRQALDDTNGEFIMSLATVYEREAVALVAELGEAAQKADVPRVGRAAHALRGSSANVGGNRLAQLCGELEHWDEPAGELIPRAATIRAELALLLHELRAFVAQ